MHFPSIIIAKFQMFSPQTHKSAGGKQQLEDETILQLFYIFVLAVLVPVGAHLSRQGNDAMVLALLLCDAVQAAFDIAVFDQQAHAAAQLSLNGSGSRSDAVFDAVLQQQIPQGQTLLIVYKQDVPAKIRIKH